MGRFRKYLVSISVFIINLVLMGVGFLFIKNYDQAKKQQAQPNNDPDSQTIGDWSSYKDVADESSVVDPLDNPMADKSAETAPSDIKVKADPTPSLPAPGSNVSNNAKPNSKTKTS